MPMTPTTFTLNVAPNVIDTSRKSRVAGGVTPIVGPRVRRSRSQGELTIWPSRSPSSDPMTRPATRATRKGPMPRWAGTRGRGQATISGLLSVETRVCVAIACRMNFGSAKLCWCVAPSQ
jgi:hypothetical protein